MRNFKKTEQERQTKLIQSENSVFYGDKGGGWFMGKPREFVLQDRQRNIFKEIQSEVLDYFNENDISWWGGKNPTGHVLSSQMACINHLFAIRNDKEIVLKILNGISTETFKEVLPIKCDEKPAYISFEVVSKNDYLNEGTPTRGSNCTSIDALILAKHQNGEDWLIPIEWKYTEHYGDADKSTEDSNKKSEKHKKGDEEKGKERLKRYKKLIDDSAYLKSLPKYRNSVYFFEPFYQLMRQTLWAEQMMQNKDKEIIQADNFLHIHVIPKENGSLLDKVYKKCSGKNMKETWQDCLNDESKYQIVHPKKIVEIIKQNNSYTSLVEYLTQRY